MSLRRAVFVVLSGIAAASAATAGIILIFPNYRWANAPTTTCTTGGAGVEIHLATQPIEWGFLAPDDRVVFHYVKNGDDDATAPFDPADGTGSQIYAGFADSAAAFPLRYVFRLETKTGVVPVYQSALAATCTGAGTTSAVVVNWVPAQSPRYYRWSHAPAVACLPGSGNVQLRLESQPVEWKDLPPSATFDIVYLNNGTETPTGPFDLPEGDGDATFGSFLDITPSYPFHFAIRLDTKVGGSVVYQSVLLASCTADGAGTARVFNVPEPGETALALVALPALALRARRRARA